MSASSQIPLEDLSVSNLAVTGHVVARTVTAQAYMAHVLDVNALSIHNGAEPGFVLTAINTNGDTTWAPMGDLTTNGTVEDSAIAVYDGTTGDVLRASAASVLPDGTLVSSSIRFPGPSVAAGLYVRALDDAGNLEYASLPGGGNVTTGTVNNDHTLSVWTGAHDLTDTPFTVSGTTLVLPNVQITSGTPGVTKVLASDAVGNGVWSTVANAMLQNSSVTVATGAGLTGGGAISLGGTRTLSIPSAAVTNGMLQNSSLTVATGAGLTGGGAISLGGTRTLSIPNAAVTNAMLVNSSVTVPSGAGLTGGGTVPLGSTATALSIAAAGVTNAMLQHPSLTITAGTGLTGGGVVNLGNSTTLSLGTSGVTPNTYGSATQVGQFTVDSRGRITSAANVTLTAGSVTSVATGAGLTGGPITTTGTISVANAGITNAMLLHPSLTITAGTGLTGGGAIALGATGSLALDTSGVTPNTYGSSTHVSQITVDSLGRVTSAADVAIAVGSVTSVATGAGLTGGPITTTGTISIPNGGVINAMLANSTVNYPAGARFTGGGAISLGGTATPFTLENTADVAGGSVQFHFGPSNLAAGTYRLFRSGNTGLLVVSGTIANTAGGSGYALRSFNQIGSLSESPANTIFRNGAMDFLNMIYTTTGYVIADPDGAICPICIYVDTSLNVSAMNTYGFPLLEGYVISFQLPFLYTATDN